MRRTKPRTKGEFTVTENEQKRLQQIREKIALMREQEKVILAKDKQRQRKERTHRLIQNGALAEKYLQCENITPQEFEKLLRAIVDSPAVKEILSQSKT